MVKKLSKSERTRKILREELAELLMTKKLEEVTVNELAKRANIVRSTFYTHYSDIYDLYEQAENDIESEINELLLETARNRSKESFLQTLGYIKENPKICKLIFSKGTESSLRLKIRKFVETTCKSMWAEYNNADAENKRIGYIFKYHTLGCVGVIEQWVLNDFEESEKFILKTFEILENGAKNMLAYK